MLAVCASWSPGQLAWAVVTGCGAADDDEDDDDGSSTGGVVGAAIQLALVELVG